MAIDLKERERIILDTAAKLVVRQGYNKTTVGDVADEVGLNRALVYTHFKSKDELLEALIRREMGKYGELWIEHIENDPEGGTVASIYRSIVFAMSHTPFMTAIFTRDEHAFGKYLRKPGNIFATMPASTMSLNLLQALQDAGTIRQGANIPAIAYIMDVISYGLVGASDVPNLAPIPSYSELMETLAEMFDRMLTPEGGGNTEAGKYVLRQLANCVIQRER
jgi:AcrR family transcriptional regulator